jgi:hypothetical protein
MASTILVDKIDPQSGTSLEIGSSGNTISIPSGATFTLADGQNMAPSFFGTLSGNQSVANGTTTIVQIATEVYDQGSVFDTSTYRFTPGIAGSKFFIYGQASISNLTVDKSLWAYIYKNGSIFYATNVGNTQSGVNDCMVSFAVIDTPNATDYYDFRVYHNDGSSENLRADNDENNFGAFRIMGV